MSNRSWSAPPVIENATALFAAVASPSTAASAVTSVVFSTTVCVAGVVHSGALSFLVHQVDREGLGDRVRPVARRHLDREARLAGLVVRTPT